MSILGFWAEDLEFLNGAAVSVTTTGTHFRAGYARCTVVPTAYTTLIKSTTITPVASLWFSAQTYNGGLNTTTTRHFGVGRSGTDKGIYLGTGSSAAKLALLKYDGSTTTQLAAEVGTTLATGIHRFDMQIVNFGASATINVYLDGVLLIAFSGDASISGITDLDSVYNYKAGAGSFFELSEMIIADEDTRALSLAPLALTGAGTTDDWTGTYSNINGTTISDASPAYVNISAKDEQFNVTDLPAGTYAIRAVKIAARALKSSASTPTKLKLGYNDGGSVAFGAAAQALTAAWATYEQLDAVNPHGSVAWDQSIMNALQVDVQSVA